ncbi:bifunctional hydroxymethylpyrimidine kinase/phosphomethylpyrimidine kinase [Vibrio aestuarianus]|uniref:bifunctional hydroxymethylpyrimidine kinase/phosphomethylpyrimidine kinase n=1 Tax=Vibrio aestuarianus TaxID=28171 RepID=UPI00237CF82E|nr:bifunctional hydroxymethylpyrimidine kinase/phosphomethylpyrimidine kinase [Vibrio aestuarianus]MDE1326373.1 bifunctional hydroxymethylpyrimidine kinase/phosphomethylpyrimidine kinase [Vibrio aestuarianus]
MFQANPNSHIPIVLTIAGSDSGGGAGIQADIKAISATGGYACSVITALTAQNTQRVSGVLPVPVTFIEQQLDAVFTDLNIIAVKVGMLADANIIQIVAQKLRQYQPQFIVLDPVMVATSGDLLLQPEAIDSLKTHLLPIATVVTPNLAEAAALLGSTVPTTEAKMHQMAEKMRGLDCFAVLLKGGHLEDEANSNDLLITADKTHVFQAQRIATLNTHGTGCTLSSAIASYLAQGNDLQAAVSRAKQYLSQAISCADRLHVGHGHGPVDHFYNLRTGLDFKR